MIKSNNDNLGESISARGLLRYAEIYLNAYLELSKSNKGYYPIYYYLLCHSIEVSLKAFLYSKGVKEN